MINLQAGLGMPPIVAPGFRVPRLGAPATPPGNAPLAPIDQVAASRVPLQGCVGCASGPAGVGDLTSWWSRIPRWAKIGGGVVLLAGVSYGVYRLVR